MESIECLTTEINQNLAAAFEANLRAQLKSRSKAWLTEQLIRLSMPAHYKAETKVADKKLEDQKKRAVRLERLCGLHLCPTSLLAFISEYGNYNRDKLIAEGFLFTHVPVQGLQLIDASGRSEKGEQLLLLVKDILFGLLFGNEQTNTQFQRTHREILSMTVPRHKSDALGFMQAATQHTVLGTWQDPSSISHDVQAENIVLEVEYGDTAEELVGDGIVLCLRLINFLEVNEQVLYARMTNLEQSTLIC